MFYLLLSCFFYHVGVLFHQFACVIVWSSDSSFFLFVFIVLFSWFAFMNSYNTWHMHSATPRHHKSEWVGVLLGNSSFMSWQFPPYLRALWPPSYSIWATLQCSHSLFSVSARWSCFLSFTLACILWFLLLPPFFQFWLWCFICVISF